MSLKISEQLMHCTIRIEILNQNEIPESTGTGFFFSFNTKDEKVIPVLVTNKHVIQGSKLGRLVFTMQDSNGYPIYKKKYSLKITNFEKGFIFHPDSEVDLCIMPINPFIEEIKKNSINLFIAPIDESMIPTQEQIEKLSALEDIIMIGYPSGLWDEINNLPIIRSGITAIHPKFDYNGKTDIIVDIACFPGSSGSPIIIFNEGSYLQGTSIVFGDRLILLGTLYAGPQQTAIGEIQTVTIPTRTIPIAKTNVMINLGYAVKSNRLLDFKPILESLVK